MFLQDSAQNLVHVHPGRPKPKTSLTSFTARVWYVKTTCKTGQLLLGFHLTCKCNIWLSKVLLNTVDSLPVSTNILEPQSQPEVEFKPSFARFYFSLKPEKLLFCCPVPRHYGRDDVKRETFNFQLPSMDHEHLCLSSLVSCLLFGSRFGFKSIRFAVFSLHKN